MRTICYLCNKEINGNMTEDHVVPRQLIDRKQPRVKGFDYGGFLPTHAPCNNNFGPESFSRKALKIISVLNDPNCVSTHQHVKDFDIVLMTLNSECFKEFSKRDLHYFKVADVRENSMEEIKDPQFIKETPKTNFKQKVLFTTFAVLTKSAAAYLISRNLLQSIPSQWEVIAIPYYGNTKDINFDEIIGEAKPFDVDVKIYSRQLNSKDFMIAYIAYGVLLYVFFKFSNRIDFWNGVLQRFPRADHYIFNGSNLNDLINYQWVKI